jgi:hypothetical protein
MGHTIWVETHGLPTNETSQDCSVLHRLMDNLDALAGKLGVRKLSDFYDYHLLEEEYGDLADETEDDACDDTDAEDEDGGNTLDAREPTLEKRQAKGEWFDSAIGLKSVHALREHLLVHFNDLEFTAGKSNQHWPDSLMDDLQHCEGLLSDAATRGQKFRLLIVP